MHLHGVPMDENDDKGRPPYPIVRQLSSQEVSDSKMYLSQIIKGTYLSQIIKGICLKL